MWRSATSARHDRADDHELTAPCRNRQRLLENSDEAGTGETIRQFQALSACGRPPRRCGYVAMTAASMKPKERQRHRRDDLEKQLLHEDEKAPAPTAGMEGDEARKCRGRCRRPMGPEKAIRLSVAPHDE